MISSVQHYHCCQTAAETQHDNDFNTTDHEHQQGGSTTNNDADVLETEDDADAAFTIQETTITADDIRHVEQRQWSAQGHAYADNAVTIARSTTIWEVQLQHANISGTASIAQGGDLALLDTWRSLLHSAVDSEPTDHVMDADVLTDVRLDNREDEQPTVMSLPTTEGVLTPIDPDQLLPDQHRAFDIIAWHLQKTLLG